MKSQSPNPTTTTKPKVMLVTDVPFWLEQRGSSERISKMLDYLVSFCDVTVCFIGELSVADWNLGLKNKSFKWCGPGIPGRFMRTVAGLANGHAKKTETNPAKPILPVYLNAPVSLADFHSATIADYVESQLHNGGFDLAIIEYVSLSYLCKQLRIPDGPILAIDTHDVMHIRSRELEAIGEENWLKISMEEELDALSGADTILAIQEHDAELLQRLLPDHLVCLTKHATDLKCGPTSRKDSGEIVVGFVGSAGIANQKSIELFLKECWPRILSKTKPKTMLRIAGGIRKEDLDPALNFDQVEFVGKFDDSELFYASIDIAINPAMIASGLKIKSIDALAHSTPLIATSAGLAGLESSIGVCAVLANDISEFADLVVSIANSPERMDELTFNCAEYVEANLNSATIYAELRRLITTTLEHRS